MKPFAETTPAEFEQAWRVANLGAFVVSQIVLPHMPKSPPLQLLKRAAV